MSDPTEPANAPGEPDVTAAPDSEVAAAKLRRRELRRLRRERRRETERRNAEAPATPPAILAAAPGPASADLRRARARRLGWALLVCVGLPTLASALYYGKLAPREYESVAVLTIEGAEMAESQEPLPARNRSLAPDLGALRAHVLSRFARNVSVTPDASGTTLTVAVRASSAARARELARTIVSGAGRFVDGMSGGARRELVTTAEARSTAAQERLARALAAGPGASALELELAREQMSAAMRAAEEAQIEAARRHRHLVVVSEPSLARSPSHPRVGWSVATVFFGALVLLFIGWLLVAVVREHAQL